MLVRPSLLDVEYREEWLEQDLGASILRTSE
jgi:hypothetical protein